MARRSLRTAWLALRHKNAQPGSDPVANGSADDSAPRRPAVRAAQSAEPGDQGGRVAPGGRHQCRILPGALFGPGRTAPNIA